MCWYCGSTGGPWESDHQVPVSRGGPGGANVVRACKPCNHLKGKLTLEEFRSALERRLGVSTAVVFAGEATPESPATPITTVRSLASTQVVVKLDPVVAERLDRALTWIARRGRGQLTRKDAVSAAVATWLDELADAELDGADFPSELVLPFKELAPAPIVRAGETSQSPRVVWDRAVTKIAGGVLEQARQAVSFLAGVEGPMSLVDFITGAVSARLDAVEQRYPAFGPIRAEARKTSSAPKISETDVEEAS